MTLPLRAVVLTSAVALVPLCLAGQSLPSSTQATPVPFEWLQDRPLVWGDFLAPPDASSKGAALTAYEIQSRTTCEATGPAFRVSVQFLPTQSWVKPRQRTAGILSHEQGHFDLAEVTARRLRAKLASLELTCADGKGTFTKLVTDFNSSDADQQRSYDRQTMYGTDSSAQRRWEAQIKSWMRAAAAQAPTLLAPPQMQTH